MEAISNLDGIKRTLPSGIGEGTGAVTHEHLDARVGLEPGGDWLSFVGVQHVHRPMGFQIHQHRGVTMAARQRELIDAEDTGRAHRLGG